MKSHQHDSKCELKRIMQMHDKLDGGKVRKDIFPQEELEATEES